MSEGEDKDSKSNEPTEKKISDAMSKGQGPVSREVPVFFSFLGILVATVVLVPTLIFNLEVGLRNLIEKAGSVRLDSNHDTSLFLNGIIVNTSFVLMPGLICLIAAGVISSLVQNPFQISLERIMPQASRISPKAGFNRVFGFRGFGDFLKSLLKFVIIGLIVFYIIKSDAHSIFNVIFQPPQLIPGVLQTLLIKLISSVAMTALVLAILDTVWSRLAWRRDLRMSHQEIKNEHKDAEGNPMVKVRARGLARQRSSRRMMAAVPKATVVITNPTHYAIALRYVRSEGGAPVVVAKGLDIIALKIRKIAEEQNISIIENRPLARAMYEKVDINSEIPSEFFMAVAELIHFLQMRSVGNSASKMGY